MVAGVTVCMACIIFAYAESIVAPSSFLPYWLRAHLTAMSKLFCQGPGASCNRIWMLFSCTSE